MKIPVRLPIEVGKKYYLGDGRPVQIYNTTAGGDYPIHGALYTKRLNEWTMIKFTHDGRITLSGISEMDIAWEEWIPQDKELVWCWDDNTEFGRILKFYDAVNCATYNANNGQRNAGEFDHYAPFEGEYPEWAKEAVKKLEK